MACQPVEVKLPYREETNGGLLCTTTDTLFGPLFESIDEASEFCDWLREHDHADPRQLDRLALIGAVQEFRADATLALTEVGTAERPAGCAMSPTPSAVDLLNSQRLSQRDRNAIIKLAGEIAESKAHGMIDREDVREAMRCVLGAKLESEAAIRRVTA